MQKMSKLLIFCILYNPAWLIAANTTQGKLLYEQNCSICHGAQGISTMASAPNFKRGEALAQSDFALLKHINTGKNACPAFTGILQQQQAFDVIAYLRTLYR